MGMSQHGLHQALSIVARMYSEMSGVLVRWGERAMTDGKTVWLPRCNDLALNLEEVAIFLGYLFHEISHVLHTNFDTSKGTSPFLRCLINLLEDIRIEMLITEKWRTTRKYLIQTCAACVRRGLFAEVKPKDKPSAVFQAYLLYRLRHDVLGQTVLKERMENATAIAKQTFSTVVLAKLDALSTRIYRCKNTDDVRALAEEMLKLIQDEMEENPEPMDQPQQSAGGESGEGEEGQDQQSGQGSQSGEGEDQDGSQSSSGGSDSQDGEQQSGQSGQSGQDGDDQSNGQSSSGDSQGSSSQKSGSGKGKKGGSGGSAGSKQQKNLKDLLNMSEKDIAKGLGELLAKACEETSEKHPQTGDLQFPEVVPHRLRNSQMDLNEIRAFSNAIRTWLLRWRTTAEDADEYYTRAGMKIDNRRMPLVRTGKRIFKKSDEGIDLQAAISLVIDRSGSMSGDRITQAVKCSVAAIMAFDHPSIKSQVIAFPYGRGDEVSVIKGWEESYRKLASRIPSLNANGGTPMSAAILFSGACLAAREEKRKIMLVVTDGDPNCAGSTIEAVKEARKNGIAVLGLGIGCKTSHIFGNKDGQAIKGMSDLAPTMINLLKNAFVDA
jgi:nitric oxide reductase activation protein